MDITSSIVSRCDCDATGTQHVLGESLTVKASRKCELQRMVTAIAFSFVPDGGAANVKLAVQTRICVSVQTVQHYCTGPEALGHIQ